MKCPLCAVAISLEEKDSPTWPDDAYAYNKTGYQLSYGHCPDCHKLIVFLQHGPYHETTEDTLTVSWWQGLAPIQAFQ